MKACSTVGIQPACTSAHKPTGHAETARIMRTRQEACLWLQEWTSPFPLIRALEVWIADDNEHDRHATLGCQSPRQFERHYDLSHGTPFGAT
jgi:hypothetical protein